MDEPAPLAITATAGTGCRRLQLLQQITFPVQGGEHILRIEYRLGRRGGGQHPLRPELRLGFRRVEAIVDPAGLFAHTTHVDGTAAFAFSTTLDARGGGIQADKQVALSLDEL